MCRGRIEVENQSGCMVMRLFLKLVAKLPADEGGSASGDGPVLTARSVRVQRRSRHDVIRHFEDIDLGDEAILGTYSFDAKNVASFCALAYGQREQTGLLVCAGDGAVPNWHLPAAWMKCLLRYYEEEAVRLSARGLAVPRLGPAPGVKHLRWMRPVRIGESITFRVWAERKIEIASQRNWGLLVVGAEGFDSGGDVVVSFCPQMLIERAGATV